MRSSYAPAKYDEVLTQLVVGFRPTICVELGVLDGFSACALAEGLRTNGAGHLDAYDLFDQYPYKHGEQTAVQAELDAKGLTPWVTLHQADAYTVHERYEHNTVYVLHVDISNDGETIRRIMSAWDEKMVIGGVVIFEGGSSERDQEPWMLAYQKPPIKTAIETDPILNSRYVYATYLKWPSLTTCLKKRA